MSGAINGSEWRLLRLNPSNKGLFQDIGLLYKTEKMLKSCLGRLQKTI